MTRQQLEKLLTGGVIHDKKRCVYSAGFKDHRGEWIELGWVTDAMPEEGRHYVFGEIWRRFVASIQKESAK